MGVVTLAEKPEVAGIKDVTRVFGGVGNGARLDASAFTTDLTVAGYGKIATSSGDDDVTVTSGPGGGVRTFDLGDGDDTIAERAYNGIGGMDTVVGGDSNDTLVLRLDSEASVGPTGAQFRGFTTTNMTGKIGRT